MIFRKRKPQDLQDYVEQMIAHQDKLRAFIYSLVPGSPDTDDILQNTNVILWQKREQFSDGTNFTAWAFRIARIQTMHQLDRKKRDGRLVFSDQLLETIAKSQPSDLHRARMLRALDGCLEKLTDHQRSLINARYTPGQSLEKHAGPLNRSPGSLRIALHRIRDALKICIENTLANDPA